MHLSAFTLTLIFVIILAGILLYAQEAHASNLHRTNVNVGSQNSGIAEQISRVKNITYEYIYSNNGKLKGTAEMVGINAITVNSSAQDIKPGKLFSIRILYNGYFGFNTGDYNSTAFLQKTVNLYYFGYRSSGADNLLVYDNLVNVSKYFVLKNSTMGVPTGLNPSNYLQETVYLEPTSNASGKTWNFCGGLFLAYLNDTHSGGQFSYLSFNGTYVHNSSMLNFLSDNCASVKVS
ncbi:hypothetical protein Micr_00123 [Candidatus Micrarchaeum sp.]|jgi:hypothetical protein|nr:MAG: hypothetical protein JJ59_02935 [Candidatus Micrarchaeum sp. AZ1]OWP54021.1 MAG: hypothetical protein B2I19_00740 [Thermoplasmatales archaeon ARMAN]QRF73608.1 hypothetical protein Micr_00123 [Candidatus Micrarchaeum sp.]